MSDYTQQKWLIEHIDPESGGWSVLHEYSTINADDPEEAVRQFVRGWPAEQVARSRFRLRQISDEYFEPNHYYTARYAVDVEVARFP